MKRQKYLDWDTVIMGIAQLISFRSKDPNTRHGAVIVDPDYKPLSMGYNGFARGCSDDIFPWTSPEKYDYVVHAERNAIDNSLKSDLRGCRLYLWSEKGYLPCPQCAAGIIQKGITEVIIASRIKQDTNAFKWDPTIKMFEAAKVNIRILPNPIKGVELIVDEFENVKRLIKQVEGDRYDDKTCVCSGGPCSDV